LTNRKFPHAVQTILDKDKYAGLELPWTLGNHLRKPAIH
jgi:hypothetical protein